jgi:hypothetical protein
MLEDIDKGGRNLVDVLAGISKSGPQPSVTSGSNSVGKTLQHLLGIKHSTTKKNSLFGYKISATASKVSNSRSNLFACVPDWGRSDVKSSTEFLNIYGRACPKGKYQKSLFCTVDSLVTNSFGLKLSSSSSPFFFNEVFAGKDGLSRKILTWDIEKLSLKLNSLGNFAIVEAVKITGHKKDHYHYRYLELLSNPSISSFFNLVNQGAITLDHLISMDFGKQTAREQGPLFKVRAPARKLLFESCLRVDLMEL